jgi:hypothetical protein
VVKYINPNIESSYRENDLGRVLYQLVLVIRPKIIIEYGVLYGYSITAMGMALHEIGSGKLIGYDLWEKYPFRHTSRDEPYKNVVKYGLEKYVDLKYGKFNPLKIPQNDLLHVDISNDGEIISKIQNKTGYTVFEGGSQERDNVNWMIKYGKIPINNCGRKYVTLSNKFPSISMLCD